MADLAPKLDRPTRGTMPNLNKVRRVIVPRGTRVLMVASSLPFYVEIPDAPKADDAGETVANQAWFPAGIYPLPINGNGEADIPTKGLGTDTAWYFVPTQAGQDLSVWPRSVL